MIWLSLLFFGSLYFLQGAVLAFIINFQKPYLAAQGVSRENIALLTSVMLFPFIGKVFLGALTDRVPWGKWGRRKPYIFIGLTMTSLSYFMLTQIQPSQEFLSYFVLSICATLGLALFDTTADGMAIDKTKDSDQGTVQAAMLAGKSVGLIVLSTVFGFVVERHGVQSVFLILALLVIPILMGAWLYSVPDRADDVEWIAEMEPPARPLVSLFFWIFALYGVTYSITSFGVDGLMTLFMDQDLHVSSHDIGVYGSLRGVGALVGAIAGGVLLGRWSKHRTAMLALALLMVAAYANSYMSAGVSYWPWALAWGAAWGLQETTYVTLAMSLSIGRWSATIFALLMMFSNIGTSAGEAIATTMSGHFPYIVVLKGLALWIAPVGFILTAYFKYVPSLYLNEKNQD